jgi:transcription-repair coupling factor (superfamily II helicase)
MLSRFRTPAQQRETIEKARKGDIDIIVGTHRLLQPDVKFHNLGLVVIDEEQRFGVKQKEALKNMRASVDILTLTATPIPRTLNLGLHKLRDITTITTPPPGRLPIITEVRKFSEALIIKAIRHELERDGQTYVLHNRVETIGAFAEKLQTLIPEGKFVVAHGQLKPDDLEKRITAFKKGEYNVLVSSTIVENGIDLPNANTLIINKAENFGLSQLYQLRGRVGRGKRQAYAYFLYHGQKLKDDARKRLRAIVEACELGSGFQVAMRDLEIRGAGEILGSHQAGSMNTVGVSHYLRMLKKAVAELEAGNDVNTFEDINTEILLPIEALIPSYYIPDMHEKISIYQKLAGSSDEAILNEFEQDLIAEYGQLPEEVLNLFAVLRLKLACRYGRIAKVKQEVISKVPHIVLTFTEQVMAEHIIKLIAHNPKWQISGMSVRLPVSQLTEENVRAVVETLTDDILVYKEKEK